MLGDGHVRFGGGPRKRTSRKAGTAPRSDRYTKQLGPEKWTYFHLYVVIDIYIRYVPGWLLATRETAALAERLLADPIRKQNVAAEQLTIHADRGTSMASKPVALLLADLGVTKSHSRPHCSNDNPYSEAQFKTLKYRPEFPARFGSIEDGRAFCLRFFPLVQPRAPPLRYRIPYAGRRPLRPRWRRPA
jgi:transposase InsO family protein